MWGVAGGVSVAEAEENQNWMLTFSCDCKLSTVTATATATQISSLWAVIKTTIKCVKIQLISRRSQLSWQSIGSRETRPLGALYKCQIQIQIHLHRYRYMRSESVREGNRILWRASINTHTRSHTRTHTYLHILIHTHSLSLAHTHILCLIRTIKQTSLWHVRRPWKPQNVNAARHSP